MHQMLLTPRFLPLVYIMYTEREKKRERERDSLGSRGKERITCIYIYSSAMQTAKHCVEVSFHNTEPLCGINLTVELLVFG